MADAWRKWRERERRKEQRKEERKKENTEGIKILTLQTRQEAKRKVDFGDNLGFLQLVGEISHASGANRRFYKQQCETDD